MNRFIGLLIVMTILLQTKAYAQEYTLSIQPTLSADEVKKTYQPLADYLSRQTGHKVSIRTYRSFFVYWQKMKKAENFDLVLDAAHFTDYRIQDKGYTIMAKIPDTVSYSLVTHEDLQSITPEDLILKNVATMPSPWLGGIKLYEIFNDPSRLPREVTVHSAREAVTAIAEGRADAAIIPTTMVKDYDFLRTIITTQAIPDLALSASPVVPEDVVQSIQQALMSASESTEGRLMLKKTALPGFVATDNKEYSGYSKLLKNTLGYSPSILGSL